MEALDIAQNRRDLRVVSEVPMGIQKAILSVVKYALDKPEGEPMQISFAWAPAYDWNVKIWEAHAIEGSPAALTILLEGPYPND